VPDTNEHPRVPPIPDRLAHSAGPPPQSGVSSGVSSFWDSVRVAARRCSEATSKVLVFAGQCILVRLGALSPAEIKSQSFCQLFPSKILLEFFWCASEQFFDMPVEPFVHEFLARRCNRLLYSFMGSPSHTHSGSFATADTLGEVFYRVLLPR